MNPPKVSIIIPTSDGYRGGAVPRLLTALKQQTYPDTELILVKGVSPQGKAINQGADRANGDILLIMDDDSYPADTTVIGRLVEAVVADPTIGMAGASLSIPPSAGLFQKKVSAEYPRFCVPAVDRITDSDMACHGCCAIPRKVFNAIGRENEEIVRGLDPDLRERLRNAGYRVVLVPGAGVHHPLPGSLAKFLKVMFRNGIGSAYAQKVRPELVFVTEESVSRKDCLFVPFQVRILSFPLRIARYCAELKLFRMVGTIVYGAGMVKGLWVYRNVNRKNTR